MGSPIGGGMQPRHGAERKTRMSFLVVHDISEQSPYAILKVNAYSAHGNIEVIQGDSSG